MKIAQEINIQRIKEREKVQEAWGSHWGQDQKDRFESKVGVT